jgi:hypothetical protein
MSKTIALDQLPRHVEILLRATGEGRESVVFAHNGKPVAAVLMKASEEISQEDR